MFNSGQFKMGQNIRIHNEIGQIRLFDNDLVVVKLEQKGMKNFTPPEFYKLYSNKELVFLADHKSLNLYVDNISPNDLNEIKRREKYLTNLEKHHYPYKAGVRENVIQKVSVQINDQEPPSPGILGRWYSHWVKSDKDTVSQVIKKKQTRSPRISQEVLELMDEVINEVYMKRNRPTCNGLMIQDTELDSIIKTNEVRNEFKTNFYK